MTHQKIRMLFAGAAIALLLLTSCAAEGGATPSQSSSSSAESATKTPKTEAPLKSKEPQTTDAPREQAEDCGWDTARVSSASIPAMPSGSEGDFKSVLIGSWQHTHYDDGAGYVPLDTEDIRFVFPTSDRLLYCQHIPNVTEYAENAGDLTWDGNTMMVGGNTPLYTVEAWSSDVMVWVNERDGSRYLLQRH